MGKVLVLVVFLIELVSGRHYAFQELSNLAASRVEGLPGGSHLVTYRKLIKDVQKVLRDFKEGKVEESEDDVTERIANLIWKFKKESSSKILDELVDLLQEEAIYRVYKIPFKQLLIDTQADLVNFGESQLTEPGEEKGDNIFSWIYHSIHHFYQSTMGTDPESTIRRDFKLLIDELILSIEKWNCDSMSSESHINYRNSIEKFRDAHSRALQTNILAREAMDSLIFLIQQKCDFYEYVDLIEGILLDHADSGIYRLREQVDARSLSKDEFLIAQNLILDGYFEYALDPSFLNIVSHEDTNNALLEARSSSLSESTRTVVSNTFALMIDAIKQYHTIAIHSNQREIY